MGVVLMTNGVRPARSLRASIVVRSGLRLSSDASTITAPFFATCVRRDCKSPSASLLPIAGPPECNASSGEQHVDLLDAGLRRGPPFPGSLRQLLAAGRSIGSPLCDHVRTAAAAAAALRGSTRSDVPPDRPRPAAFIPGSPLVSTIADPGPAVRQIPAGPPIAL